MAHTNHLSASGVAYPVGMADDETVTELHECARYGELDEMKTWLEAHPTLSVDAMDGQGATPLHKACANGHVDIVQFLLSKGAKHVQNKNGAFPLSWAILNKHVRLLTEGEYSCMQQIDAQLHTLSFCCDILGTLKLHTHTPSAYLPYDVFP